MWAHQADVELLLKQLEEAEGQRPRASCNSKIMKFAVNRFCMRPVGIMVIATFAPMMSGFMAVNVALCIPGMQTQLRSFAQLPEQLVFLSGKEGEADGMMGLVRPASHLFNLAMGPAGNIGRRWSQSRAGRGGGGGGDEAGIKSDNSHLCENVTVGITRSKVQ